MQTFMPYDNFLFSAKCLDTRRLGNQRNEAKTLYTQLTLRTGGWLKHPAARMWEGHTSALLCYLWEVCYQWKERGIVNRGTPYTDNVFTGVLNFILEEVCEGSHTHATDTIAAYQTDGTLVNPPWWLGDRLVHESHRAALLAKDPGWYGTFGWTETPQIKYFWPTAP